MFQAITERQILVLVQMWGRSRAGHTWDPIHKQGTLTCVANTARKSKYQLSKAQIDWAFDILHNLAQ